MVSRKLRIPTLVLAALLTLLAAGCASVDSSATGDPTLVTALLMACETDMDGLLFRADRASDTLIIPDQRPSPANQTIQARSGRLNY